MWFYVVHLDYGDVTFKQNDNSDDVHFAIDIRSSLKRSKHLKRTEFNQGRKKLHPQMSRCDTLFFFLVPVQKCTL